MRLQDEISPDFRIEKAPYRGDGGDAEHRAAHLRDNPFAAFGAVEKEVLRRIRKRGRLQPKLTLLEPGLWTAVPQECWDLELKLSKKQETEFLLIAPEEPQARAEFEENNPDQVATRKKLLSKLKPLSLFADSDDDEEVV